MDVIVSLDLSTSSTGWSVLDLNGSLLEYGLITPQVPKVSKLTYPRRQLYICENISEQLAELINKIKSKYNIAVIVVEEVNRHMNRLAGKTLDILHGYVWKALIHDLDLIKYIDSDGADGWRSRSGLSLIMTDQDKDFNKQAKKLNKTMAKGTKKIEVRTKKHLACDFVNKIYSTNFNVDENDGDSDICDSIGLGYFYYMYKLRK